VRMTLTAISPRLAMRTFLSTLSLSNQMRVGGPMTEDRRYNTGTPQRSCATSGPKS
jgi:hypothetical protein